MNENNLTLKSIAVYCGSNTGNVATFSDAAKEFAKTCVARDITLIYGGSKVGLMGVMADQALKLGGKVIGVLPKSLLGVEIAHESLNELHLVDTMHERKALMNQLADGFVMLPGGAGSLDEFFEAFTWAQLGYHDKPCGILNVDHYYDHLLQFLEHAVSKGFIKAEQKEMIRVESTAQKLLAAFATYQAKALEQ